MKPVEDSIRPVLLVLLLGLAALSDHHQHHGDEENDYDDDDDADETDDADDADDADDDGDWSKLDGFMEYNLGLWSHDLTPIARYETTTKNSASFTIRDFPITQ